MELEENEYKRGKNRKKTAKEEKEWDLEIVPFEDLEWEKVTNIIDPENMPLTTCKGCPRHSGSCSSLTLVPLSLPRPPLFQPTVSCHAIHLPARYAQLAFSFVRKHAARFDELAHLKRVRQVDRTETSVGANSTISVLLFPVHTAPTDFATLFASSSLATTLAAAEIPLPEVFQVDVPATIARTDAQAEEWGRVWPVQMVHIREGPKALPRSKGWERAKEIWIRREVERVWNAAKEAGERGEVSLWRWGEPTSQCEADPLILNSTPSPVTSPIPSILSSTPPPPSPSPSLAAPTPASPRTISSATPPRTPSTQSPSSTAPTPDLPLSSPANQLLTSSRD